MNEEEEDIFPADDDLFDETFSADCVYTFCGEELKINQAFSANLGVAAPVWDAVSTEICHDLFTSFVLTTEDTNAFCYRLSIYVASLKRSI